jgi:hypothetical protein
LEKEKSMCQPEEVVVQLERAKRLIREEIQGENPGKSAEVLKVLELITASLGSFDALPHSL